MSSRARARGLIRALALGPSGMLTASTPASLRSRADFRTFEGSAPRGGTTSTHTPNLPSAIFLARGLFCSVGTAVTSGRRTARLGSALTSSVRGLVALTALLTAAMWEGVVPQQPPSTLTPS